MKHYVNFSLLLAFGILITSALLRFFKPFSLATTRIHIIFGSLVLLLVALHLASRLAYFPKMLRKGGKESGARSLRLLLLPVVTCSYLLTASFLSWWPVPQLLGLGYEVKNRAIIFRPEEGSVARPVDSGTQIKRETLNQASVYVEFEWGSAYGLISLLWYLVWNPTAI